MSEATEHTASACDRLLDFVYGELAGDELAQFEAHLAGCDKCKREVAGLERVRSAVKQAMPELEPASDKMAAMHAQLMHAAAQQKPKRGTVLMFVRRVVNHPAYAAAAALIIVGGAVAYNFTAGRVMMPEKSAVHEAVPLAPPPAGATTVATEEAPNEKTAAEPQKKVEFARGDKAPEPTIVLNTPSANYGVKRAAPAKKDAPADELNGLASSGKMGKGGSANRDDSDLRLLQDSFADGASAANTRRNHAAPAREVVAKKPVSSDRKELAKNEAPPPAEPMPAPKAAEDARPGEGRMQNQGAGYAQNQAPAAPPVSAAAPAPAQAAPALDAEMKTQSQKPDLAQLKKQAEYYATNGRCDDAVAVYQQIEKLNASYLKPVERANYVRCLRQTGRDQVAEKIAAEEQSKVSSSKKASKAKSKPVAPAAADSATKNAY